MESIILSLKKKCAVAKMLARPVFAHVAGMPAGSLFVYNPYEGNGKGSQAVLALMSLVPEYRGVDPTFYMCVDDGYKLGSAPDKIWQKLEDVLHFEQNTYDFVGESNGVDLYCSKSIYKIVGVRDGRIVFIYNLSPSKSFSSLIGLSLWEKADVIQVMVTDYLAHRSGDLYLDGMTYKIKSARSVISEDEFGSAHLGILEDWDWNSEIEFYW